MSLHGKDKKANN